MCVYLSVCLRLCFCLCFVVQPPVSNVFVKVSPKPEPMPSPPTPAGKPRSRAAAERAAAAVLAQSKPERVNTPAQQKVTTHTAHAHMLHKLTSMNPHNPPMFLHKRGYGIVYA